MEGRLRALGWCEVDAIDEDLGKSAAGTAESSGFQGSNRTLRSARPAPSPRVSFRASRETATIGSG